MKKYILFFALVCSNLCAADHFDYYDALLIETNLGMIQEIVYKYQGAMETEDYGEIMYYLNVCKTIAIKQTERAADQAK